MLFTSAPKPGRPAGCRSIRAAEIVPIAAPVASPCSTRAAISQPTFAAARNAVIETISRTSAAASTGRRPT
jgi:hypothetical protein